MLVLLPHILLAEGIGVPTDLIIWGVALAIGIIGSLMNKKKKPDERRQSTPPRPGPRPPAARTELPHPLDRQPERPVHRPPPAYDYAPPRATTATDPQPMTVPMPVEPRRTTLVRTPEERMAAYDRELARRRQRAEREAAAQREAAALRALYDPAATPARPVIPTARRPAVPAPPPPPRPVSGLEQALQQRPELERAIILAELLEPPLALRPGPTAVERNWT